MNTNSAQPEPSNWNVPNALTVFRIVLVPVFLIVLLHDWGQDPVWRLWATIIFVVAMFTDKIDGDIARKYNLITNFGKIADPIADKSLTGAAWIGLAIIGSLPWWVPVIILVREFGITALRFIIIRYAVMPASKGGKLKTMLQTVAIAMFLILPLVGALSPTVWVVFMIASWVVLTAAIVVTIVTGVDYLVSAYKLVKAAKSGEQADA